MKIEAVYRSHIGNVREKNEDNLFYQGMILPLEHKNKACLFTKRIDTENEDACFAVFDGMGGEKAGEEASYIAADTLQNKWLQCRKSKNPQDWLLEVCLEANSRIVEESEKRKLKGMGTTTAAIYLKNNHVYFCNVGDSRIYSCRNGTIEQCSVDHSDKAFLIQQGIKGRKPRLTQHLGIEECQFIIEPHRDSRIVKDGEIFLLCTDGVTDMVSDDEISDIVKHAGSAKLISKRIVNKALENGGRDNISLIVCKIFNGRDGNGSVG